MQITIGSMIVKPVQLCAPESCVVIPDHASANQWYESSVPTAFMFLRGPHLLTEYASDSKNGMSLVMIHHR